MVIKEFLFRTGNLARGVLHFGRLGKVAGQRSFLNREKKKFLLKVGEKATELVRTQKIHSAELTRLVGQIDKIDSLLSKKDYGGEEGTDFKSSGKQSSVSLRKGRRSQKSS